jgi:hypothetical protein
MQEEVTLVLHPVACAPRDQRDARKLEAEERARSRVASSSPAQLLELARTFLHRAHGSASIAHKAARLEEGCRPNVGQIAKCVEVALFNTEELLQISWNVATENGLNSICTEIDQAEGLLASIDATLWDDGWEQLSDQKGLLGALDAAVSILLACMSYMDDRAQQSHTVTH